MQSGIYRITNIKNKFVYIGSSENVERRIKQHKYDLRTDRHHNKKLLNAWVKYGPENFLFEIIEFVEEDKLEITELFWMEFYQCYDPKKGYNICIKPYSGKKAPKPCSNCKKPSNPLRKGICHACDTYFNRHGKNRPYRGDGRIEKSAKNKYKFCRRCKRPLLIKAKPIRGYCASCYTFFNRRTQERRLLALIAK